MGKHGEASVGILWPLLLREIPVEFDAILIGIGQIDGVADTVVGGTLKGDAGFDDALDGVGEVGAGGIEDGDVEEASAVGWGWLASGAFPGVDDDVMMITTGREEDGAVAVAGGDVEA